MDLVMSCGFPGTDRVDGFDDFVSGDGDVEWVVFLVFDVGSLVLKFELKESFGIEIE